MTVQMTRHAVERSRQRGFRNGDLELLLRTGSLMQDGAVMLTDADLDREMAMIKQQVRQLERLRGMKAVIDEGRVVTMYHASRRSRW